LQRLHTARRSSSHFGTSVRVTRYPAPGLLGMTGDIILELYPAKDIHEYAYLITPHGTDRGARTVTFQTKVQKEQDAYIGLGDRRDDERCSDPS